MAIAVYIVNFFMTLVGFGLDSANHSVSLSTNGVTLIFGALISYLVKGNIDIYRRDRDRYAE
mgnify:CR=1 FL=1